METRRNFLKKLAYTTPLIMTLAVRPAVAGATYGGTNVKPSTDSPPRAPAGGGDSHAWWAVWRNW